MKKERKIVWIKPNKNPLRCPVRIVEKYLKLLPTGGMKPNLYLHSLKRPKPHTWYCETPLGINKVRSVVKEILHDAGLDGFFTNHSLHRTAATCLFQAGQNVKLIKEVTGNISNAVEKYEITSDQQRMNISSIIQGEKQEIIAPNVTESEQKGNILELTVDSKSKQGDQNSVKSVIESA